MPNSTCRLLSNGYKFDTDANSELYYRPCCLFPENQKVEASAAEHDSYRKKLNAIDSFTDNRCGHCNFLSKKKLRKTWRDNSFDIVPDDANVGDASYLELQVDRTCNGGCIMCGPWYSSYWANELKIIPVNSTKDNLFQILNLIDISKTRKINFLGGEPFLSNSDSRVLALIPQPELVDIQYTINGSIYPTQQRIDLWSKHKSVLVNFSIDAVGDRFEYIRYPLKWKVVTENIDRMTREMPDNVVFKVNHTVNIFNLYYHDEFESWYSDLQKTGRFVDYTFSLVNGPLNIGNVTEKLFELLSKKYLPDSKVMTAVNKNTQADTTKMLEYISEIDLRRGLNWRNVFSEISECF